jgi:hypothetical protein
LVCGGPWRYRNSRNRHIEKISSSDEATFPPLIRHVMHEFNSGTFVRFLSDLTGISGLIPDPDFSGCGMHSTGRGGRLMIHADASRHPNERFDQVLNVIYYVTPDWGETFGGELELWDEEVSQCVTRIGPAFNSMVAFVTGSHCYHGHPHPLNSPPNVRRNSLAAYYYLLDRPHDETYHSRSDAVLWKRTNALDRKRHWSSIVASIRQRLAGSLRGGR